MQLISFEGRAHELIRASDIVHDGMWLELWDKTYGANDYVLAAFYSDQTGRMTFTAYRQDLPLDLIAWFIQKARELLPPNTASI